MEAGDRPADPNEVGQWRFDALELGEIGAEVAVDNAVDEPGRQIREYRARFVQKRRELIRDALIELMAAVDGDLGAIGHAVHGLKQYESVPIELWEPLRTKIKQIEFLLGSSVQHPPIWTLLRRHLHFGCVCDFHDISRTEWPSARDALTRGLYGENEPLPQKTTDLGALVSTRPRGAVATKLNWAALGAEDFERLLFALISKEPNYENPEWSMKTNAPDRGRDLAVFRISKDGLSDVVRKRVIIQCKHWLTKSLGTADVAAAIASTDLWDKPPVDDLIIATSGRFSVDAVQWIEKRNDSRQPPRIEMWPESRLEFLLAERPWLIAEFRLR